MLCGWPKHHVPALHDATGVQRMQKCLDIQVHHPRLARKVRNIYSRLSTTHQTLHALEDVGEKVRGHFNLMGFAIQTLPRSSLRLPWGLYPGLYRSSSTGGAMQGLETKPRRLAPAQHFPETGLRRRASFFVAACEKGSGATHALQSFLESHIYQHFQANKNHYFTSSGKTC
jgi:hypothetical protein